jgi:hypothetical protein
VKADKKIYIFLSYYDLIFVYFRHLVLANLAWWFEMSLKH